LLFGVILGLYIYSQFKHDRIFETEVEFKAWLNDKHFTSDGKDVEQMDIHGNLHMPVGTLELRFANNKLIYESNPPQNYDALYDAGKWVVSFKKTPDGDDFELVVPPTGDCYIRSIDYDTSKMEEMAGSAINKLDAISSKHVVDGPIMKY
jgi:hypothetical protein